MNELAARFPLRVVLHGDEIGLEPVGRGVDAFLAQLLADVVRAELTGTWSRIKLCQADECQVVFYDASRNGSRRWCSMRVCGNRSKTRSYYHRQQSNR